ncbi:MAG TPA: hypothetical protein VJC18_02065, partial [bacterium]|nr:hypothetical protein [bacterium]
NKLAIYLNSSPLKKLGERTLDHYLKTYFNMSDSLQKGELLPSTTPTQRGELAKNRFTTAGFLIMSLIERAEFEAHKKEITLLADWLLAQQRPDGIFRTQFADSQYFDSGQLLLAIATLYEKTREKKYKDFFDKSFEAYASQLKQQMSFGGKYYTAYAPAWFTQPFAKMYFITQETKYRDLVFALNDPLLHWYEIYADHPVYFDYDGVLVPKTGSYGNNSVTSAALESLVDAALVARTSADTQRYQQYTHVIKQTVAHLMRLQYTPANTYYIGNKRTVTGGFKSDLIDSKLWMDNVWHLTSAFIKIHQNKLLPD